MPQGRSTQWSLLRQSTCLVATAAALMPWSASAQELPPLERQPIQWHGFETANGLRVGEMVIRFGSAQTLPDSNNLGTGNQVYYASIDYAFTDRLTFGLSAEAYEDPVLTAINGAFPEVDLDGIAASVKYSFLDGPRLKIAGKASAEYLRFQTGIFGTQGGVDGENLVGSVQVPVTFQPNNDLQYHFTPGVSIFPDTLAGNTAYGIIPYIGAGASYRLSRRLAAYGSVKVPFGPNGNTVNTSGGLENVPVVTAGLRFNITPKGALDIYATNGVGTSPATGILTHWPGGDDLLAGFRLTWTPGRRESHRTSYIALRETTRRERALQHRGFTLASADTHEPGTLLVRGWYGGNDSRGVGVIFTPEYNGQFEAYFEDYANDGSVPASALPTSPDERYMVGAKLRFLDQNNGDPFSFSIRGLGGRDLRTNTAGSGVIYGEATFSYKVNENLALTAAPKLAAFGASNYTVGLGLGANYELFKGLEIIAEVTPTESGQGVVWAAGARYTLDAFGLSVDAHATNAIGQNALGSLVAQNDPRFGVSVTKWFDVSGWR